MQLGKDQTEIEFLVNTEAAYSCLNEKHFEMSNKRIKVVGATGNGETRPFFKPLTFKIGKQWVTHQLLLILVFSGDSTALASVRFVRKIESRDLISNREVNVLIPESKFVHAIVLLLQEDKNARN